MNGCLAIFGPLFFLGLWTFVVLNVLGVSRIRAAGRRQVRAEDFRLGESENVPDHVRIANRNYMNLLELPVLFYTIVITVFVTGTVSPAMVTTAWLFVGLRAAHSLVHLTTNNVAHRLCVFVASNTALLALWAMAAWAIWFKAANSPGVA